MRFPARNPERDEKLAALWGLDMSTARIGEQLGISKNAVIGRAHRMGLPPRPSPIKRPPAEKPAAKPRPKTYFKTPELIAVAPPPVKQSADVPAPPAPRGCQFIEGDPVGAIFCDAPTMQKSSYCPDHHARCYRRDAA